MSPPFLRGVLLSFTICFGEGPLQDCGSWYFVVLDFGACSQDIVRFWRASYTYTYMHMYMYLLLYMYTYTYTCVFQMCAVLQLDDYGTALPFCLCCTNRRGD